MQASHWQIVKNCATWTMQTILCACSNSRNTQHALDKLTGAVAPFDIWFVSKNVVLLQKWGPVVSSVILDGEQLTTVDPFSSATVW